MKYIGTFKSSKCAVFGQFENHMCEACSRVPTLPSFKKRALKRHESLSNGPRSTKIRNEYLTRTETIGKLRNFQTVVKKLESKVYFLTAENIRLKTRRRTLKEELLEYSHRGSMKQILYKLQTAKEMGKLDDKVVLADLLKCCANNFHAKNHGQRYGEPTRLFFESVLLKAGPQLATFITNNLLGPEVHTIFRWRKQHQIDETCSINGEYFMKVGEIYKGIVEKRNLPRVPVFMAEDETAIIGKITYNQKTDELVGFCGQEGLYHRCEQDFRVKVGDGEDGYNNIVQAFQQNKIGMLA